MACGLERDGGEGQLTDELIGQVCERVRPHRADGHGEAWATLKANHAQLKAWLVTEGLTVVKAHDLLVRRGVVVPQRTLHRYALESAIYSAGEHPEGCPRMFGDRICRGSPPTPARGGAQPG